MRSHFYLLEMTAFRLSPPVFFDLGFEETEKNRGRCESDTSFSLMAAVRTGGRCG
jgi:hypothetical protein